MVRPLELNESRNIYYFPVVTKTDSNNIRIIPLESSNSYVSSTGYVDASGYSTHPDIFSFISQEGITEAPNYEDFTFDYLLKYSSTNGVVVSSNDFDTTTKDISFIPDNTSNYYTGTIQNRFITFTNLAGHSTIFNEYPNRQLNNFITKTTDDYPEWEVDILEECKINISLNRRGLTVERHTRKSCEKPTNYGFPVGFTPSKCENLKTILKQMSDSTEDKKYAIDYGESAVKKTRIKFNTTQEKEKFKCGEYEVFNFFKIEWEIDSKNKYKIKINGSVKIDANKVTADNASAGRSIFEAAIGGLASIATAPITLPAQAVVAAANAVLPDGAVKDGINVVGDPAGSVVSFAFDKLNDSLKTRVKDLIEDFEDKLNKNLPSGASIQKTVDVLLNTPAGDALIKLADVFLTALGRCPCAGQGNNFKP